MHTKSKTGFVLVPERGALVLQVSFEGNQVLETYTKPEELEELKWSKAAILFPFPNRLKDGQFSWLGKTYTWPINNASSSNAIHGMVREAAFQVVEIQLKEQSAEVRCRYEYDGSNPSYPFAYTLDLSYRIHTNNRFWVSFHVVNKCDHAIPAGFGWHPYFKLDQTNADAMQLTIANSSQVLVNERMLPTGQRRSYPSFQLPTLVGETELDTCFAAAPTPKTYRLSLQTQQHTLSLVSPVADFPYFQVFTPPHRESIALEPMTCNVDALNNHDGLKQIEAGASWKGKCYLEWK